MFGRTNKHIGQSYVLNTQKAFLKIPGFTIVSLLAGYISIWLSVNWALLQWKL